MQEYLALVNITYCEEPEIRGHDNFQLIAENHQQALDFSYARAINNDYLHNSTMRFYLQASLEAKYDHERIEELEPIGDQWYDNHIKLLKNIVKKIRSEKPIPNNLQGLVEREFIEVAVFFNPYGTKPSVETLDNEEISTEWKDEIWEAEGYLKPSRLSDEEIKNMLRKDAEINPDSGIDVDSLEDKVFMI